MLYNLFPHERSKFIPVNFIIILISFTFILSIPLIASAQFMRNSAKECAICHFRWLDQFYVEGRGTDLVEYQKERVAGSEMICYTCHNGIMVDSRERFWSKRGHECNMKPSKKVTIPPEMPLGAKDEVVCATCHTVHGVSDELRYQETIYLRHSNRNSEMCLLCHVTKGGGKEQGNHPIHVKGINIPQRIFDQYGRLGVEKDVICETCHTVHGTIDKNLLVIPDRIDEKTFTSELCEACHGKNPSRPEKGAGMGTHPVDIEPKTAKPPKIWEGERKVASGVNGQILCETCHWAHNAAPQTSIIAKKGESPICLDCHKVQSIIAATKHDLTLTAPLAINIYGKTVNEKGVCSPCHMPHNAGSIKLWSRKIDKEYPDGVSNLCVSCHEKRGAAEVKMIGAFSHPVERELEKTGGKTDLPLFDKKGEKIAQGKVTCATCHNAHQWDFAKKEPGPGIARIEGDRKTSFLRTPDEPSSSLCLICHQNKKNIIKTEHDLAITAPTDINSLGQTIEKGGICSPCHLVHNGKSIKMWARELDQKNTTIAGLCISCHQEKKCGEKKVVGVYTHPTEKQVSLLGEEVKIQFPQYDQAGQKVEQKGLITCASCHDTHQWSTEGKPGTGKNKEGDGENSFLRMANDQNSSLCVSCHQQKVCVIKTDHDLRVTAPKEVNILNQTLKQSGVCGGCHVPHQAGGIKIFAKKIEPTAKPNDFLCMPCHNKDACGKDKIITSRSHPMPDRPELSLATIKLPLYDLSGKKDREKGKLACSTCHEPHQWNPAEPKKGDGKKLEGTGLDSFLRQASAPKPELCVICHKDQESIVKTNHDLCLVDPNFTQGTCAACHTVHNGADIRLWARPIDPLSARGQGPIDLLCQSCHLKGRVGEKKVLTDGYSHKVNVSLAKKGLKTHMPLYSPPLYTPMEQHADKEKGDIMTCQTCHEVHQWAENMKVSQQDKKIEGTVADSFLRLTSSGPGYLCADCHEDKKYLIASEHDMRLTAPAARNLRGQTINEGGVCSPCHAVHHASRDTLLWDRSLEGEPDFMVGSCVNCHKKKGVAEAREFFIGLHPSNFVYTGKILEQQTLRGLIFNSYYPLYDTLGHKTPVGFVTCATCHDPHTWDPVSKAYPDTKNIEGDPTNSFLRNKGPAYSICLDCHGLEALLKYKNYHQPSEWKPQYWRRSSGDRR